MSRGDIQAIIRPWIAIEELGVGDNPRGRSLAVAAGPWRWPPAVEAGVPGRPGGVPMFFVKLSGWFFGNWGFLVFGQEVADGGSWPLAVELLF